ncbi:GNAT family N-acetyltransferase [Variovorax sp. OV329]|uniref:GNAT family N-acetyltransferase n=1 Tax=Variovorax sp. OV329 TaxID=1882825 RepID=UPI0008DFB166|nr:GNAT family N-acetyltransferase [Variovorax sp. OV329]SFM67949.1 Acetyltransferase (GNAT) domain-containing protein [Variovorax sp. OV329]
MLEDLPLDPNLHDRNGFDCGVPALDEYLSRFADQHRRRGITSVYVLADSEAPRLILGYYTLSAAEVDAQELDERDRKRLPRYPVPCFRMGRLACRTDQRGKGIGSLLVGLAVDRCLKAREQVAAYALLVDAKDEQAKLFYERYGFSAFAGNPLTLYLPLGK